MLKNEHKHNFTTQLQDTEIRHAAKILQSIVTIAKKNSVVTSFFILHFIKFMLKCTVYTITL